MSQQDTARQEIVLALGDCDKLNIAKWQPGGQGGTRVEKGRDAGG